MLGLTERDEDEKPSEEVLRTESGGSWRYSTRFSRTGYRGWKTAPYHSGDGGFRVVRRRTKLTGEKANGQV